MSYAVCISHEAEEALRGIYAYITFNLLSPKSARGQIDRIEKAIQSLHQFPLVLTRAGLVTQYASGLGDTCAFNRNSHFVCGILWALLLSNWHRSEKFKKLQFLSG